MFANRGVDESFGGAGNDVLFALARGDVSGPGDVVGDTLHGEEGDDQLTLATARRTRPTAARATTSPGSTWST